jgi:hypothetical protein
LFEASDSVRLTMMDGLDVALARVNVAVRSGAVQLDGNGTHPPDRSRLGSGSPASVLHALLFRMLASTASYWTEYGEEEAKLESASLSLTDSCSTP